MESFIIITTKSKAEKMSILENLPGDTDFSVTGDLKGFVEEKYNVKTSCPEVQRAMTVPLKTTLSSSEQQQRPEASNAVPFKTISLKTSLSSQNSQIAARKSRSRKTAEVVFLEDDPTDDVADAFFPPSMLQSPTVPLKTTVSSQYQQEYSDDFLAMNVTIPIKTTLSSEIRQHLPEMLTNEPTSSVDIVHLKTTPSVMVPPEMSTGTFIPFCKRKSLKTEEIEPPSPSESTVTLTGGASPLKRRRSLTPECRECGEVNWDRKNAEDHAVMHTDLYRYECSIEGCNFKHSFHSPVVKHVKKVHGGEEDAVRIIELTAAQTDELESMTKKCYPEFYENN